MSRKRERSFEDNSSSPVSKKLEGNGSKSGESEWEDLLLLRTEPDMSIHDESRNPGSTIAGVSDGGNSFYYLCRAHLMLTSCFLLRFAWV